MATEKLFLATYKQALLQMAAYRSTRAVVHEVLDKYELNSSEWIILGLVNDKPGSLRVRDLTDMLQVEGPFITKAIRKLETAGYLHFSPHPFDKRARLITLTDEGQALVLRVEPELSSHLEALSTGLSSRALEAYFDTLRTFIDNVKPLPQDTL